MPVVHGMISSFGYIVLNLSILIILANETVSNVRPVNWAFFLFYTVEYGTKIKTGLTANRTFCIASELTSSQSTRP